MPCALTTLALVGSLVTARHLEKQWAGPGAMAQTCRLHSEEDGGSAIGTESQCVKTEERALLFLS